MEFDKLNLEVYTPASPRAADVYVNPGRSINIAAHIWDKATNAAKNFQAAIDRKAGVVAIFPVGPEGFTVRATGLTNRKDVPKELRFARAPRRSFPLSKALGNLADGINWPASGDSPVKGYEVKSVAVSGYSGPALVVALNVKA